MLYVTFLLLSPPDFAHPDWTQRFPWGDAWFEPQTLFCWRAARLFRSIETNQCGDPKAESTFPRFPLRATRRPSLWMCEFVPGFLFRERVERATLDEIEWKATWTPDSVRNTPNDPSPVILMIASLILVWYSNKQAKPPSGGRVAAENAPFPVFERTVVFVHIHDVFGE